MDDTKREWVRSWLAKAHSDFRYPDTLGVQYPSITEVSAAIEHAQAIYDFVHRLIPEEARPK